MCTKKQKSVPGQPKFPDIKNSKRVEILLKNSYSELFLLYDAQRCKSMREKNK